MYRTSRQQRIREGRGPRPRYCSFDGGDSSSSSSQATSTTNKDLRVAGGSGTSISADASTITVTDGGSVNAAFGFAREIVRDAFDFAAASESQVASQVTQALKSVESAWAQAKAGEQKVLVGMGLIVVGVVAVQALKKG